MWKKIGYIIAAIVVVAAALLADTLIKLQILNEHFDQRPGHCSSYKLNGSEDIILLPNYHAIITSGLQLKCNIERLEFNGKIYTLDLTTVKRDLVSLKFEDSYFENNPGFNPHGISYWVDEPSGNIYLYVISHWIEDDSIEVFQYKPDSFSLKYIKSIRHPLLENVNNLILVDYDEFYITQWMYFNNDFLHFLEDIYRLPLTSVFHYKKGKVTNVATGLRGCNGINKSRNSKFIYVANSLGGEIITYKRNTDGSLTSIETFPIPYVVDNISVDRITGHLWVAVLSKATEYLKYCIDKNHHLPSQTLHVAANDESDTPLASAKVEQVFQSTLHGGTSTAFYTNGTLLLGTIFDNLTICEVNYLMY